MTDKSDRKQKSHLFKPGQSGNPAGRPRGSGLSAELRASIASSVPEIVEGLIRNALSGDPTSQKLLLDRYWPALRPESLSVQLPGLDTGTLVERAQAALAAAGRGEVPVDTATSLVSAVGALARIHEVDEIERRLTALEAANGK